MAKGSAGLSEGWIVELPSPRCGTEGRRCEVGIGNLYYVLEITNLQSRERAVFSRLFKGLKVSLRAQAVP